MLNIKKGLALVLAAATAFTFAPVANLSNATQAEAAERTQFTYDASKGAWDDNVSSTPNYPFHANGIWTVTSSLDTSKADYTGLGITVRVGTASGSATAVTPYTASNGEAFYVRNHNTANVYFDVASPTRNGKVTFTFKKVKEDDGLATSAATVTKAEADRNYSDIFTLTVEVKKVNPEIKFGSYEPTTLQIATNSATSFLKHVDNYGNSFYTLPYRSRGISQDRNDGSYAMDAMNITDTLDGVSGITESDVRYTVTSKNGNVSIFTAGSADYAGKSAAPYWLRGDFAGEDTITVSVILKSKKDITVSGHTATYEADTVLATKDFKIVVGAPKNIKDVTWFNEYTDLECFFSEATTPEGYTKTQFINTFGSYAGTDVVDLDLVLVKSVKLNVNAAGTLAYTVADPTVATVDQNGNITAVKQGYTKVTVNATAASGYENDVISIPVHVSSTARDIIKTTVDDVKVNDSTRPIELDKAGTNGGVNSAKIVATAKSGSPVTFTLVSDKGSTTAGDSSIASVSADGTVTAGTKVGTVYVRVSTPAKGNILAGEKWVKVNVNALPAATINADDITLDLTTNKTKQINASVVGNDKAVFSYTLVDPTDYVVDLKYDTVTAKRYGTTKVLIETPATATYRRTAKTINVTVVQDITKKVSDLAVAADKVTLKAGETAKVGATVSTGSAITYSSDDTAVATVSADGTITAVAPGKAVITVNSAATTTMNPGVKTVTVTVTATKPAKVTGVKVANLKGGKVKVTWKADSNPNVKYYVKKTIGKKNGGKSVGSNSTTLTVKKGATIKVKVKAYVFDETGTKLVGSYSKTVTKKTDKK
jgi:hypothetical protein